MILACVPSKIPTPIASPPTSSWIPTHPDLSCASINPSFQWSCVSGITKNKISKGLNEQRKSWSSVKAVTVWRRNGSSMWTHGPHFVALYCRCLDVFVFPEEVSLAHWSLAWEARSSQHFCILLPLPWLPLAAMSPSHDRRILLELQTKMSPLFWPWCLLRATERASVQVVALMVTLSRCYWVGFHGDAVSTLLNWPLFCLVCT